MALWLKILICVIGGLLIIGAILLALLTEPDKDGIIRIKF